MSERLRHLQRQQALLREHLAWIENEIARETPDSPPPVPLLNPATVVTTPQPSPPEADALLEKYASDERQNPADIRRGCFIVFASALALLAAGVIALWLLFYR